ncbi:MFS transporter [Kibdelosporangium persicum]|uniref:MFS transporter n=1 Tax=Kibdelosporangium persicum TaxID=2698649 RepID=A0ABX2FHG1_9PSEU|nr:MFS transporter [Kibdelosporangium persicum]NRN70322.1 MFS transporter [Kibdelosporangium persicum]
MRYHQFPKLWAATAASNLGDGLVIVCLPLIALQIAPSPGLVVGVGWAQTMPQLLCTLIIGVLVDRADRRQLMLVANIARAIACGVLALSLFHFAHPLVVLYTIAFLLGVGEIVSDLAGAAMLPTVVEPDRLTWANSRLKGTESALNEFVGPPLGGALVAVGGVVAMSSIGGVYLLAAGALLLMRGQFRPVERPTAKIWPSIAEGLRYLWRHKFLRDLAIMVCVMAGAWAAWLAVLVIHVVEPGPVGLSTTGFGILLSTLAVGGVLGALAADRVQRVLGTRNVLLTDVITTTVMLGMPALTVNVWIIGATTFLGGFGSGMWNVTVAALRQRIVPDELLGRVSAAGRLIGLGSRPVAIAGAAVIVETVGTTWVFAVAGMLCAALLVPFLSTITPSAIDRLTTVPASPKTPS